MENKKAAVLVLALATMTVITAGEVYAAAWQAGSQAYSSPDGARGPSMGPGLTGGQGGYPGRMMGGFGENPWTSGSWGWMYRYMEYCWNSTSFP